VVVIVVMVTIACATTLVLFRAMYDSADQDTFLEVTDVDNDTETSLVATDTSNKTESGQFFDSNIQNATIFPEFGFTTDSIVYEKIDGIQSFDFLIGYLVELGLALFLYFPLIGTILFSGFLGCKTMPFLGGRPRELKREKRKQHHECEQLKSVSTERTSNNSASSQSNP